MTKIGILSGTFDPVHKGHISFALKSIEEAGLDKVYFMPEAVPRRKAGVTHYAHRIAMLRLATKPHRQLDILDFPDKQFTVRQTLPRLKKQFPDDELYLLLGSDIVPYLAEGAWPGTDQLLATTRIIVGMRSDDNIQDTVMFLQEIIPDRSFRIIQTDNPHASSRDIRRAHEQGKLHISALGSLNRYVKDNWLYTSVALTKS